MFYSEERNSDQVMLSQVATGTHWYIFTNILIISTNMAIFKIRENI